MSSLYKRRLKSGEVWYGQLRLRSGRWKTFNTKCSNKREAQDVLAVAASEIAAGRDPFRESKYAPGGALSAVVPTYLAACAERLRPSSIRSYKETLQRLISKLGDISVGRIDKNAVEGFSASLTTLSRHSRNIHLSNLKAFLNWYRREISPQWTPPAVHLLRTDPLPTVDYYNGAECQRLLAGAHGVSIKDKQGRPVFPFYPFVAVLMFTGLRKNEAAALRWEPPQGEHVAWPWVDMTQQQIVIPAPVSKSRRPRFVPILGELQPILDDWPREKAGKLFPFTVNGGHLTRKWSEVCKTAGVKRLKLHNLRDTFAVGLLLGGVPWAVVGEILGHASVETTKRYYAAIGKTELSAAVSRIAIALTTNLLPESPS